MATKKNNINISKQSISDIPENVDPNQIIMVKNGFHGKLIYISPKTGETFLWDEFDDVQEMELKELRAAKNSSKGFFINNYFMFDDEYSWVIKYLGVTQYYQNAISTEGFDELLTKSAAEIQTIIEGMSAGQKSSLQFFAKEKISSGEIDSLRIISAIEKGLGVDLVNR